MPVPERFRKELEAIQSLARLMADAEECRGLYEAAGMRVPQPLSRFLGEGDGGVRPPPELEKLPHIDPPHAARDASESNTHPPVITHPLDVPIPPPPMPPMPSADSGVKGNWIWVSIPELTIQGLVLGVLRQSTGKLTPSAIAGRIRQHDPQREVSVGSIANVGTRLAGALLDRSEEGWSLIDPARAPLLHEGFAWGPVNVFQSYEQAAHRRFAIAHVLCQRPEGLAAGAILALLKGCWWLQVPINKDLVKLDLEALARVGRVVRQETTGWWAAAGTTARDVDSGGVVR